MWPHPCSPPVDRGGATDHIKTAFSKGRGAGLVRLQLSLSFPEGSLRPALPLARVCLRCSSDVMATSSDRCPPPGTRLPREAAVLSAGLCIGFRSTPSPTHTLVIPFLFILHLWLFPNNLGEKKMGEKTLPSADLDRLPG